MADEKETTEPQIASSEPAPDGMDAFEQSQEKFGVAYAALADGLKGEGIDKAVKITRYGLAAAAALVILAAIVASV